MRKPVSNLVSLLVFAASLIGCATAPSGQPVDQAETATKVSSVLQQPELHQDTEVVWGGSVIGVNNRADETWIEIIDRPLLRDGLPDLRQESTGRFIAIVPGFLDPLDYSNGRSITIIGTVDGTEKRKIADADYNYPLVAVADHQLWSNAAVRSAAYRYRVRIRTPYYGYSRYPHRSRYGRSYYGRPGFGFGRYGYSRYRSRGGVFVSGSSR